MYMRVLGGRSSNNNHDKHHWGSEDVVFPLAYVEGAGVSDDMFGVQAYGFENKNMLAC